MEAWREELYHHGIKGQKWGVRRYQNADGTLTAKGRKQYRKTKAKELNDAVYDLEWRENRYKKALYDSTRAEQKAQNYMKKHENPSGKQLDKALKKLEKVVDTRERMYDAEEKIKQGRKIVDDILFDIGKNNMVVGTNLFKSNLAGRAIYKVKEDKRN